ncbi:cytochrome c-type biogenesis protein [Oleiphilus messinensis]|uniref:Cytochrome c-type biogenesis protein n=1 Tax=Oleiphilus messinensis TaxID=141451 RepID=A0A1Y0I9Q1_9GAMM|nr:c-type cytochrome biogenesis protein CcmI [Oleiphilus messinensis]ARU57252.1 cytochrome c-type biogenesis protein [Oleiphilus messinensis]
MSDFWLGSSLLILLAMVFVLLPVLKRRQVSDEGEVERKALNVELFKDRLKELELELEKGQITEARFAQLKLELEGNLLEDVGDDQNTASSGVNTSMPLVIALVVIIPVAAWGFYWKWGAYDKVVETRDIAALSGMGDQLSEGMPAADIDTLLGQLKQKLQENPENIDGWFLLGRTQMNLEQYAEASESLLQVVKLLKQRGEGASAVYGLLAQARFFQYQQMTEEVKQYIETALQENPNEVNSLGLLGMYAYEVGEFKNAIGFWQRILEVAPDHPSASAIGEGINRARMMLASQSPEGATAAVGQPIAESAAPSSPKAASGPQISVLVELSDSIDVSERGNDTLFIYARAVNGPKMPLAIVRKQVKDLPVLVKLDDSTAMGPMAKLSSVAEVEVIARVSASGQPTPNPGDLQGLVSPVEVNSAKEIIRVEIDSVIQ